LPCRSERAAKASALERFGIQLCGPPLSQGRIRYPPSSHSGLPGQIFCAFRIASASGERVCVFGIAAPCRGVRTALRACATDAQAKASNAAIQSTVRLCMSSFALNPGIDFRVG
jgi:hypothetical protein